MANELKLADAGVNAEADALSDQLDDGYLRIYDDTAPGKPATADDAVTTQVLLAELRFGNPSAPAAVAGVLTFNALTPDSAAPASGTATWFRAFRSDGTTPVLDGTVGLAGCDLNLNSVDISAGAEVSVTGFEYTVVKE